MNRKIIKVSVSFAIIFMFSFLVFQGKENPGTLSFSKAYASDSISAVVGKNSIVEIAKKHNPAVASITVKSKMEETHKNFGFNRRDPNPFGQFQEPFGNLPDRFRDFFERMPKRNPSPRGGSGSGFVIDAEGHIFTNHHVIDNAGEIKVTLDDTKEYDAVLIGSDPKTDIALIKIVQKDGENETFPYLNFGDSDELQVGEWVVAIGNPFGLSHTVTTGVVSAKGRNIGAGPYDEFIQTDASINPGNSGGPLLNLNGDVIGVNTAIISGGSGGNVGIGFATPINVAKKILPELKENGSVTRGWLGVMIQKLTPELAQSFNMDEPKGALVGNVTPNSPASKGGIKRGDVIVKFDDNEIGSVDVLPKIVAETKPGKSVEVELIRNGKVKNLNISIAALDDDRPRVHRTSFGDNLGIQAQDITPELAQSFSLENSEGVLVSGVTSGEPASEAGLKRGDVIVEVNRQPVRNVAEYQNKISKAQNGSTVLLLVKRSGNSIYVAVRTQ
jgi:serine protease Do